ncbi:MAG: MATE family efflux transporter, partial [Clostridiales bacterium]|nr:MATE family efflux transporter [Clostridiales bacterium]
MDTKLTEGNPLSVILKFMLPLMVGNIFQQLYNFVDTIIVGRFVGPGALAAVGSTGTVMFFIIGTTTGMVMGFTVITSQKYGYGDEDAVKKSFTNGIYLSLAHIVLSTLVMVLTIRGILVLMNTPDDIFDDAYSYISIICWGIFATAFYNYFSSILRA